MSFSIEKQLPANYFQEVINALVDIVITYLDELDNPIIFSPYCGTMMANFKFYSYDKDDSSPLLHYTFSNLEELNDQLYYFWVQLIYLLKKA